MQLSRARWQDRLRHLMPWAHVRRAEQLCGLHQWHSADCRAAYSDPSQRQRPAAMTHAGPGAAPPHACASAFLPAALVLKRTLHAVPPKARAPLPSVHLCAIVASAQCAECTGVCGCCRHWQAPIQHGAPACCCSALTLLLPHHKMLQLESAHRIKDEGHFESSSRS